MTLMRQSFLGSKFTVVYIHVVCRKITRPTCWLHSTCMKHNYTYEPPLFVLTLKSLEPVASKVLITVELDPYWVIHGHERWSQACVRLLEIRLLSILETSLQWRRWQDVVETASFQWESNRIIMIRTRNGSLKLAVGLRHSITHKGKNHIIGPLTMNLSLILLNAALHLSARSQLHDILSFRSLCSAHHWKKMFNVEGEPNDNNIKHRLLCRATEERARLNRSFLIWKCC